MNPTTKRPAKRKALRRRAEGHIVHIAVNATMKDTKNGKVVTEQVFNYDVTLTIEMLDYAVRRIAGGLAQAFERVSENGLSAKKADPVAA